MTETYLGNLLEPLIDDMGALAARLMHEALFPGDERTARTLICLALAQLLRAQPAPKPEELFPQPETDQVKHDRAKRRILIPADWRPNAKVSQLCAELGMAGPALDKFVAEFVSYWQGVGKPRADWNATFRNRVISARGGGAGAAGPRGQSRGGRGHQSLFGVTQDLIGAHQR